MKNKYLKSVGNILSILAVGFIFYRLFKMDIDYSTLLNGKNIVCLLVLSLLYAIHLLALPWSWRTIIEIITGNRLSFLYIQKIFCKANLMKYIPGNVFQYVGRNEVALDHDLPHGDIALTTVMDVIANILGVLLIAALCFSSGWNIVLESKNTLFQINTPVVIGVLAIILLISFLFRKQIGKLLQKIKVVFLPANIKNYLKCIGWYSFFAVYTGIMYVVILNQMLGLSITGSGQVFVLVGAYLMSWLLGFVVPGAPGGIGVREAALTLFLSPYFNTDIILFGIVIYRLVNVIGDFIAFLVSAFINPRILNQADRY